DAQTLRAHLALVLLDSGRRSEAERELGLLERSLRPCGVCDAVRVLDEPSSAAPRPPSLSPLRPGWSATALRIRILEASGERDEARRLRAEADRASRARLMRVGVFVALAAACLYAGVLSIVFELRYPAWRV